MKLVFMGTPDFAVPSLQHLAHSRHSVLAVVTNPDRPRGRGRKPAPPPLKKAALDLDLDLALYRSWRWETSVEGSFNY